MSDSASGCVEFDYAPGQPNLYRMMRYKQGLVAANGVDKAYEAFRLKFGWPEKTGTQFLTIVSERDFAAANARRFRETGVAGIEYANPPPRVHGEGNQRSVHGTTRSQYVACLDQARVRGRSAAVVVGESLLLDFQNGELEKVDEEFSWDPSILHWEGRAAWYLPARNENAPLLIPAAFNLLGAHTDFFGHWMCEYLPKYAAALFSGLPPSLPVLIDASMPPSHRRSLELLLPERGPIIEIPAFTSVMAEELWVAPDISYYPLYDSGTGRFQWDAISVSIDRIVPIMEELRRRAENSLPDRRQLSDRVFLSRKPFRHRRLVNDDEIHAEAQARGFAVVYPEDLSFDDQVLLIRGAEEILLLDGSALFLVQFARPGTKICCLCHPMVEALSDMNAIFLALGLEFDVMTGPVDQQSEGDPHDSSYRIDREGFRLFLSGWLS
jgi:capsular polysaccharide biosynthesis protein